jgi:hypothetical protein
VQTVGVTAVKAALALAAAATLLKLARDADGAGGRRHTDDLVTAPSIGIIGILTLLIAPATATYHFVLLWLPVGLLVRYLRQAGAPGHAYVLLGSYALIGFFPYGMTARFEGRGVLSLLAYPRLFLLLGMFASCLHCVWRRPVSRPLHACVPAAT